MDVSKLKNSYPNPPVYSVSWEILFETDIKINELKESINNLAHSLQSDFSGQKPFKEFLFDQKINLNETESLSKPERRIIGSGVEIKTETENEVILIGTHKLFIITKDHLNYDNFSKLMKRVLDKFQKSFSIENIYIYRLGIRYINHCPLPEDDTEKLNQFFTLNLIKFKQSSIINLNVSFQELINKRINFRTQYHSISIKNKPAIAIDLDCFEIKRKDDYIKFDELTTKSTHMAKLIKEKFALSITEDFVKTIMEKER